MPKNTPVQRIETLVGLTEVGLTIGAIVTKETLKTAATVGRGMARYMGQQGLRALQHGVEVTDAHSHGLSIQAREQRDQEVTREQAMENLIVGLISYPHDSQQLSQDFQVLAGKLNQVEEVSDGIRLAEGPDGIVPMRHITEEFVLQLASMADEFGIDSELAQGWTTTLRQHTGLEYDRQMLVSEQLGLDRLLQRTRETAAVTV